MRTIPRCYYNKALIKIIDGYIEDGFNSYSDLSESDKEIVTAQCIDILGDDAYSCIIDSENFHKTLSHFTKILRTADKDYSYELVDTMRKNATAYFIDDMDELFDERCRDRYLEKMYDYGMKSYVDPINGETIWRKSA